MKTIRQFLSLLLAMMLCLSLVACGTTAETTNTTQTTTATTPSQDAQLEKAFSQLKSCAELRVDRKVSETVTVSSATYSYEYKEALLLQGWGSDAAMIALEHTSMDSQTLSYREYAAEGMVYSTHGDILYCSESSAADYFDQLIPVVLLDRTLYSDVATTENSDGSTVYLFSQSAAGENWAVPEGIVPEDVWGEATLDSQGVLTEMAYYVDFFLGNFHYVYEIRNHYSYDTQDLSSYVPKNTESAISVSSHLIPKLLNSAAFDLGRSDVLTASIRRESYSQAGGVYFAEQQNVHSYFADGYALAKVDYENLSQYYDGTEYTYTQVEEFKDGMYSYSEDGGNPQKQSLSNAEMLRYCRESIATHLAKSGHWFSGATLKDLGSVYYLTFTATEAHGESVRAAVSQLLFNDSNYLEQFASSYRTDAFEIYMTIDRFTGLPVAVGYNFTGMHTIEGAQYPLIDAVNCTMILSSDNTYESITEEPLPDKEPEEKATPLFYKVTGPNGEVMWLFGTIHVGDDRTAYLPQEIYDALASADALALEFDSEAFQEQIETDPEFQKEVYSHYTYPNGGSILGHLSGKVYQRAKELLTAYGAYYPNSDTMKAAAWESTLSSWLLEYGYGLLSSKGVDNRLMALAKAQNKPIYDVESGLFQVGMLMGFSDAVQEMRLKSTLDGSTVGYAIGVNSLFNLWCDGDEEALRLALQDDVSGMNEEERKLYEEYNKAMSLDRNVGMLAKAIEYLESGETVFYAVGLAHLLADNGLVNTLRDAGYTVELVDFSD